jgi:hypothetical protein
VGRSKVEEREGDLGVVWSGRYRWCFVDDGFGRMEDK